MLRLLIASAATLLACSNGGAPIIVYDAALPSCASCNIFDNTCANELRCETGLGTIQCGPDKVGGGGQGSACKTPADCANGYDCFNTGAGMTCTLPCLTDSNCPNGMTCGKIQAGCGADMNGANDSLQEESDRRSGERLVRISGALDVYASLVLEVRLDGIAHGKRHLFARRMLNRDLLIVER